MIITSMENDLYIIRPAIAEDKEAYMQIHQDNSEMAEAFVNGSFRDYFWEMNMADEDTIFMLAIDKKNGLHVANCSFYNVNSDTVEIGLDVGIPFQNKGIGTELLLLMVRYLKQHFAEKGICARTKSDNLACQRMIEKAGGIKADKEPTEFDQIIDDMLPQMASLGLKHEMDDLLKAMNRSMDVHVITYMFEPD